MIDKHTMAFTIETNQIYLDPNVVATSTYANKFLDAIAKMLST